MFNSRRGHSPRIPPTPSTERGSWDTPRPDSTYVPWIPDHHPYSPGGGLSPTGRLPNNYNYNYSTTSFSSTSQNSNSPPESPYPETRSHAVEPVADSPPPSAVSHGDGFSRYIEEQNLLRGYQKEAETLRSQKADKENKQKASGKWKIIVLAIVAVLSLAATIMLPVYFRFLRPHSTSPNIADASLQNGGGSSGGGGGDLHGTNSTPQQTSGGYGSTITLENGTSFTYNNPYGGQWFHDPADPFNLSARPNSWTPPLNTTWSWTRDRISGVNLGGWLVLEPFITPGVFQRYSGAVDEFTLTSIMREQGTLAELEEHYATFITEQDIADIASAGLNWLRIPLGFWAVETYETEPFLQRTSWTYFLKAVEWARKYGLRVYLDLHAVPGGQNGMNHSGRQHHISFLNGNMGRANAQRTLYYLRVITQFISQPQYQPVVQILGLLNEPLSYVIGMETLTSWYVEAYKVVRGVTGYGEGRGPYIAIGDGLRPPHEWEGLLPNADRVIMDVHPYVAFDEGMNQAPLTIPAEDGAMGGTWPGLACRRWGGMVNRTKSIIGVTIAGEFSSAINDCGLFLREVGIESAHPQCPLYDAWEEWDDSMKAGLGSFVTASMDAVGDWFFWTWKIGPANDGRIRAPFWSYQLGLEKGWIPKDPRTAQGKCAVLGVHSITFDGNYQPWQTGSIALPTSASIPDTNVEPSPGTVPTIPTSYLAAYPWPPLHIEHADVPVDLLPRYTNTREVVTLPVPTYTGAPESATKGMDGWFNKNDEAWRGQGEVVMGDEGLRGEVGPIEGCTYPNTDGAQLEVLPTGNCQA